MTKTLAISCILLVFSAHSALAQMCGTVEKYKISDHDVVFASSHASPTDLQISSPEVTVENADIPSFKVLFSGAPNPCGTPVAEDSHHVYFEGRVLTDDVAQFKFTTFKNEFGQSFVFGEDGSQFYVQGRPVPKDGFRIVSDPDAATASGSHLTYIQTSSAIYDLDGQKLDMAPESFQILGCNVTRDSRAVYVANQRVQQLDLSSFKRVTRVAPELCYFSDANHVYWAGYRCVGGCSVKLNRLDWYRENGSNSKTTADPASYFDTMTALKKSPMSLFKAWNSTAVE
jgi:hypothetical protein